jgi:hypothetical protein
MFVEAYRKDRAVGRDPDDSRAYSPPPAIRLDDIDEFADRYMGDHREHGRDFGGRHAEERSDFGGRDSMADGGVAVDRPDEAGPRDVGLPSFTRESGGTVTTFLPKEPPGTSRPPARFGEVRMPKQPDAELDELLADLTDDGPKRRSRGPGQHSARHDEPVTVRPEQRVTDPRVFPWALLVVALLSAVLAATAIIMALA